MRRGILLDHQRVSDGGPGINLGDKSVLALVPKLPQFGFTHIEVFLDPALYDRAERDWFVRFAVRARDQGVDLWSMHAPFSLDISSADAAARDRAIAGIESTIGLAAQAGARFVIVHPGSLVTPADLEARADTSVAALTRLNACCRNAGLRMAVENMLPAHVGEGGPGLRALLDRLPHDAGVCLDSGHAHVTDGSPAAALKLLGERLYTLHVHDNDGASDQHLMPGEGKVRWDEYVAGLAAAGFEGVFNLEVGGRYPPPGPQGRRPPLEILELARAACDRILPPGGGTPA
ncbi:MAG: sugar phosphate isomerase/epimerase [Candidatus Coatesbacteria bacterium]